MGHARWFDFFHVKVQHSSSSLVSITTHSYNWMTLSNRRPRSAISKKVSLNFFVQVRTTFSDLPRMSSTRLMKTGCSYPNKGNQNSIDFSRFGYLTNTLDSSSQRSNGTKEVLRTPPLFLLSQSVRDSSKRRMPLSNRMTRRRDLVSVLVVHIPGQSKPPLCFQMRRPRRT